MPPPPRAGGHECSRTAAGRFSHRPCHDASPGVSSTGARGGRDEGGSGGGLEPPQRWALRAATLKLWGIRPETGPEQGSDRNSWTTHHRVATTHRNTQWICQRGKRVDTGSRPTMKRRSRMARRARARVPARCSPERLSDRVRNPQFTARSGDMPRAACALRFGRSGTHTSLPPHRPRELRNSP